MARVRPARRRHRASPRTTRPRRQALSQHRKIRGAADRRAPLVGPARELDLRLDRGHAGVRRRQPQRQPHVRQLEDRVRAVADEPPRARETRLAQRDSGHLVGSLRRPAAFAHEHRCHGVAHAIHCMKLRRAVHADRRRREALQPGARLAYTVSPADSFLLAPAPRGLLFMPVARGFPDFFPFLIPGGGGGVPPLRRGSRSSAPRLRSRGRPPA